MARFKLRLQVQSQKYKLIKRVVISDQKLAKKWSKVFGIYQKVRKASMSSKIISKQFMYKG